MAKETKVQRVFRRYESKFRMSGETYEALMERLMPYIVQDKYFDTHIESLYYDTPNDAIVRASIEKPLYKEKLRVRSYGRPGSEDKVFVEIKKKYEGVVYKRREPMKLSEALTYLAGEASPPTQTQIISEIDYMLRFWQREGGLRPAMLITYDRLSWRSKNEDEDLRITFDTNIGWRQADQLFSYTQEANPLLKPREVLMELKTSLAIPLWLCRILGELGIYKGSFSKYGNAYQIQRDGYLPQVKTKANT